jgi:hypothetical protein
VKRSTLVTIGALVALGAFLLYSTLTSQKYSCTVSVTYQGRNGTATASAASEHDAKQQAQTTACGPITSGMNESIACSNTPPAKTECTTL